VYITRVASGRLPKWVRKYVPIALPHVARFTRAIPQSASPASHDLAAKILLSKSHHAPKLWGSQNIFCRPLFVWIFQIWPYPRHNPWWWPEVLAWQASPWEHRPSSSALQLYVWGPCNFLVFVKTSGTSLVLNNERYLAFYQPFLKRFSRAPYFVFLFFFTPLVPLLERYY
jgi:hypothetical protein